MRFTSGWWVALATPLFFCAPSFGAEIRVAVENGLGQPVRHTQVQLEDAQGFESSALTDTAGEVVFDNLDPGPYQVSVVSQSGQIITEPGCGSFNIRLMPGQSVQVTFKIEVMGVSVDFGRPAGGGADDFPPLGDATATLEGEPFKFAMRMEHLDTVTQIPEQLILTGQFHLPEQTQIVIDSVTTSHLYAFSETHIMHSQTPAGVLQVFFEIAQLPYLSIDGDVLIFHGRVFSREPDWLSQKKNQLCFCVQSLVFYHNGAPSQDPDLSQYARSWSQCFHATTPQAQ